MLSAPRGRWRSRERDASAQQGFAGAFDVEISAYVIDAPMHAARPEAAVVLHTHMPHATALASLEVRCAPLCLSICRSIALHA